MKPNWDGPGGTVDPDIGELGWFCRAEQALGEWVIKECQITGRSGHASPSQTMDRTLLGFATIRTTKCVGQTRL